MRSGLIGWIRRITASPFTLYVILAAVLIFGLAHQLGSKPAGLSPAELASKNSSSSLSQIFNHPLNAPHNLVSYSLHSAGLSWKSALRLTSAGFAALFIISFYAIVRAWFGRAIGLLGTLMLAATPLFLVLGRQGSPEIMYFSIAAVMAIYLWTLRSKNKSLGFTGLLALCVLLIYTPGVIWWLAGALLLSRKKLADTIRQVEPPVLAVAMLIGLLLLVPLGLAIAKDWTIIKQLGLVPVHFGTPLEVLKRIVWMALAVFAKAPYYNNLILGRLPVLDILQTALVAFGAYALWNAAKSKLIVMAAGIVFAVIAAGLDNNLALLAFGVPALSVIVCAGLRYLYIEWRSVFPHNPLARTLAYSLMGVLVAVQLLYGVRYAIIAWPDAIGTKNTYVLK